MVNSPTPKWDPIGFDPRPNGGVDLHGPHKNDDIRRGQRTFGSLFSTQPCFEGGHRSRAARGKRDPREERRQDSAATFLTDRWRGQEVRKKDLSQKIHPGPGRERSWSWSHSPALPEAFATGFLHAPLSAGDAIPCPVLGLRARPLVV